MNIKIISDTITEKELREIAKEFYATMVKGAVDIERGILALGGEYHIDASNVLTEGGSKQQNVWGFNLYPNEEGEQRVEYVALINIRPGLGNRDMYIEDAGIREKIYSIVNTLVP